MQPLQQGLVARPEMRRRRAERTSAEMGNEHPGAARPPAQATGTQAEIVLLAIALCKQLGRNRPTASRQARRTYMQNPTPTGMSIIPPR